VRPRGAYRDDQVNTLVLVNNSKRPLLLLAGEIVPRRQAGPCHREGQDRAGGWRSNRSIRLLYRTWSLDGKLGQIRRNREDIRGKLYGTTGHAPVGDGGKRSAAGLEFGQRRNLNHVSRSGPRHRWAGSPRVRQRYGGSAADSRAVHGSKLAPALPTTSYAKAMQTQAVSAKVDAAAAGLVQSRSRQSRPCARSMR